MSLPPKSPPPPLAARASRPAAVRLRGSAVKAVGAAAALAFAGALTWAFILEPAAGAREQSHAATTSSAGLVRPSERISGQPPAYDATPPRLPPPRTALSPAPEGPAPETGAAAVRRAAPAASAPAPVSATAQAAAAARSADMFFGAPSARPPPAGAEPPPGRDGPDIPPERRADYAAAYGGHALLPPLSPYEIKAGALIPAALLTAVDTSRPGPVVAATTEPVFDTVTGRILLLPQGSRLIGANAGDSAYGERRAYVVWKRIILPNGKSLLLDDETATDRAGAAGVPGRTDRRLLQAGGAALLSAAISTVGEFARGDRARRRDRLADALGDAAAGQAMALGGRLLDRELDVQPRIVVEAGARIAVLVTRDLVLEPVR